MKSKIILIAAIIMAVLTTIIFRQYIIGLENRYKGGQKKITIVVPKVDIKKNQNVTKDMLELREFSSDSVHPEAVKKIEDIVGNYALTDIKAGEVLFASRFTNQVKENELIERKISSGYRAIAIETSYVESVSNLIQPEDYVDITFSEELKGDGVNKEIKTTTLFENVRVLAVGKRIVEKDNKNTITDKTDQTDKKENEYTSVTVELKPEDIVKIVNADKRGDIKFVLRSKIAS